MPSSSPNPSKTDLEDLLKECKSSLAIVRRTLAAYPTDRVAAAALPALEAELGFLVWDVRGWLDVLSENGQEEDGRKDGNRGGYRKGKRNGKGNKWKRVPSKEKFVTMARFVELSRESIILPQARKIGLSVRLRCGLIPNIANIFARKAQNGFGTRYGAATLHPSFLSPFRKEAISAAIPNLTPLFLFLFLIQSLATTVLDSAFHSSPPWAGNCYVPFAASFITTYGLLLRDDCYVSWVPTFWFCVVTGLSFWVRCLGSCGDRGWSWGWDWHLGFGYGE
jgi:hypothetical protein